MSSGLLLLSAQGFFLVFRSTERHIKCMSEDHTVAKKDTWLSIQDVFHDEEVTWIIFWFLTGVYRNLIHCPHCGLSSYIDAINCKIFRHAVYKNNFQFIPPHAPEQVCRELVEKDQVYGCAKPFWFDGYELRVCGWI